MREWVKGEARLVRSLTRAAALPYHALRRERAPGVVVLLYHRVGGGTRSDIDMPVALFERQMRYIRRHCVVVALDDVVKMAAGSLAGRATRDVVVVTFDDGFSDTYDLVYPILRHHGVPATVYVPSLYLETQRPFDFGGFRQMPAARRPTPMTWEQAGEMARSGLVTIGAHTHSHADFSTISPEAALRELDESDRLIEARLGFRPRHFAYPWGRWAPATRALAAARYVTVTLGGPGKNPYAGLDPRHLWRYPVIQSEGFWLFRTRLHLLRSRDGAAAR
ncbi:MAG: polysaccharide deacetylase family protein [Armatimonadota bacterium]|nr:polysaccharide deacetylase family protein [Armatimonadota bacterium]